MIPEFDNPKALKAWFRSLSVEDKKVHGVDFNEKMRSFKPTTQHSLLEEKLVALAAKPRWDWTPEETGWYEDHTTCHVCGMCYGGCQCWSMKLAAKGTEDVGGFPPNELYALSCGYWFLLNDVLCIKTRYDEIEELDTGRLIKLGEWWDDHGYRYSSL